METVPLSAGPLDVHVTGTIGARPVVLVHGALVDHRVWSDVPERLAAHGLRCFTPVLPLGLHRRPMRPDADLSPSSLGRLLGELLDVLDLTDVTLVGNDTGGALCQLLVATGPARVVRLVLTTCDGLDLFPPFPFDLMFRMARHPNVARAAFTPARVPAVRGAIYGALARRPLPSGLTREWLDPYLGDAGVRRDLAAFARAWDPALLQRITEPLGNRDLPTLLVWGQRDRFFTPELGRRLATLFSGATLEPVPHAGTFVAWDDPGRVTQLVASFVEQAGDPH